MADLRPYTFDYHVKMAEQGYKEDADCALQIASEFIAEAPNLPQSMKEYIQKGIAELLEEKEPPHAFFLKTKGSGNRPNKLLVHRNIEIAEMVYEYKIYEYQDGVRHIRKKPLSDEKAIGHIADEMSDLGESTIRNAYYDYKNGVIADRQSKKSN